jgi:hypothetical protein
MAHRVKALELVPGLHRFKESGTLEIAADLATRWLVGHLEGNGN